MAHTTSARWSDEPKLAPVPRIPTPIRQADSPHHTQDLQYLGAFLYLSKPLISCFDGDFVEMALRRATSSQGAVRHALLAVACQLQGLATSTPATCDGMDHTASSYSLWQYGNALLHIKQRLESPAPTQDRIEVTVAVFLLICYEIIRENDVAALVHLEGALTALSGTFPGVDHKDISAIRRLFMMLEIQALSYLGGRKPSCASPWDNWKPPSSIAPVPRGVFPDIVRDLRESLGNLQYRTFQFLRLSCPGFSKPTVGSALNLDVMCQSCIVEEFGGRRAELLQDLHVWSLAFHQLGYQFGNPDKGNEDNLQRESQLLQVRRAVLFIQLSTCLETDDQTAYDDFLQHFLEVVSLSNAFLRRTHYSWANFTIEMGVIEPLYFVALKCRDPQLRRAAVDLLRISGKEGVWDGNVMSLIANHVIEIENRRSQRDGVYASAPGGTPGSLWPGKWARVHGTAIEPQRKERRVQTTCYVPNPDCIVNRSCATCGIIEGRPQWEELKCTLSYGHTA